MLVKERKMAPKIKYKKEEIAAAALNVLRKKGVKGVTSREVGHELNVSSRPIFTWYASMEELMGDVYDLAKDVYRGYVEEGLKEKIPFLGVWKQYIEFANKEPEIYKLLFLTPPGQYTGGAYEALKFSQDLTRESIMKYYGFDKETADAYFRNMWLVSFSFSTLAASGGWPFTDEEMLSIGGEISLSLCKAYKEIPGLAKGKYDKDRIFGEIVNNNE